MSAGFRLFVLGIIAFIAFWVYDIINSWLMPLFGDVGSMDPTLAFIIGLVIFIFDVMAVGWIILKVPVIASRFGMRWLDVRNLKMCSYVWH